MILNLAVILIAGIIAYIWSARGFFSAFLHMLCVIVAGALAFAAWEPLALWILSNDTSQGGSYVDVAWGVALAVPFALILTVIRVACDKIVPFNLDFDGTANLVGGIACGAIAGTITAGMVVLSVSFLRMDTAILGHRPMQYASGGGSLERKETLIFPADRLTAWFYQTLSNSTLVPPSSDSEGRPYSLGRMHPELADEGWLLRVNFEEGKAKSTLSPAAISLPPTRIPPRSSPTALRPGARKHSPTRTASRQAPEPRTSKSSWCGSSPAPKSNPDASWSGRARCSWSCKGTRMTRSRRWASSR
jgi:hypothetical protein